MSFVVTARAPGKIVLWGEFAVLAGAPAAVLAVDRYARCSIRATATQRWQLQSRGFVSSPTVASLDTILGGGNGVLSHALNALPNDSLSDLPAGAACMLDTLCLYANGQKLGIGSSAAICTATYTACAALVGVEPDFEAARAAHRAFQGGKGSGIDLAAAWYGGALRFQAGSAEPLANFEPQAWTFFWTGKPAATTTHIGRFSEWVSQGNTRELDSLGDACEALFQANHPDQLCAHLGEYVDRLRALDQAAHLGIYGEGHEHLHALAKEWEVVYKPCGAGGGDVGAATARDGETLAAFSAAAVDAGFQRLDVTRADHGAHLSR